MSVAATGAPSHEDPQTIQKLLDGVIGLMDTFSAEQRDAAVKALSQILSPPMRAI